ncbi:hypothetical protein HNR44_002681 [Geomicrobium halophilum]|uniref:Uncharacterized protein n=1 Tax=Geomicrobium halophilum TaxID=549000 RepID=A0A841PW92_9BACL|nr:hypothetical protein [Geomicrobium halophilum]
MQNENTCPIRLKIRCDNITTDFLFKVLLSNSPHVVAFHLFFGVHTIIRRYANTFGENGLLWYKHQIQLLEQPLLYLYFLNMGVMFNLFVR